MLVANPLNRYLINSPMLGNLKRNADDGLTLYIQHQQPVDEQLPAPAITQCLIASPLDTSSKCCGLATVGNLVPGTVHRAAAAGVQLCKQPVLRLGVALYGFRLTVQQVQALGVQAFVTDALLILSTISLAIWLGTRVLDQSVHQALVSFDDLLLAAAMAALGFSTRLVDLRKAGLKPLILAAALTLQLMIVGGALTLL
ncbi:putative sulfate exporter family transporter [Pseudomonas fluorescens]|uniref:putative sulfate exporter family transporter n=1 Tax=Pseudomonas fluorescens TaxID=294 RepID=UPI0021D58CE1|nr:putative sulfate exporter family transporter [Pseudomonas fluorescens]